jgi:hypothetical protein
LRHEKVFLAVIKPLGSMPTSEAGLPTSANDQPSQPSVPTDPSSEDIWVTELVSEFSDVFQDPLPVGLPPERSEGHSIPTEPGHPPPFRQMYRLSPLEYRELEK